ncbi:MAG: transcription antitermination factor NusB [Phycisphaeraceae bacterium]
MADRNASPRSGREAATRALAEAAARFPDLPPSTLNTAGLSPAEAGLALAIHRTTLRRWLTLEHLVGRFVKQPMWRLQPAMRAVLLAGATQLLFMDRLPAYAVVDEMVDLARRLVRPKAAAMVNGVLRNVSRLVARNADDEPWTPGRDRLPWYADTASAHPATIHLKQPLLPEPADLPAHLALATSMPEGMVRQWLEAFDQAQAVELCLHGLKLAPTIVAVEPGFEVEQGDLSRPASEALYREHARAGFLVWQGSHDELTAFLAADPRRRVQDPASAEPIAALHDLRFTTVLDYCAGRGTKTRQLAALRPGARLIATDLNADRLAELAPAAAGLPNIAIQPIDDAKQQLAGGVDLLLLDVPCSNTAVLARRPEARYRLTRKAMLNLQELQRRIVRDALPTLAPQGHILYSTCSVDPGENQQQARWIAKQTGGQIVTEHQTLPAGVGATYHDGSYHALIATTS